MFSKLSIYNGQFPQRNAPAEKQGSSDGAVVIALASHQCDPGSNPRPGVTVGLSLLLVLVLAPRVFLIRIMEVEFKVNIQSKMMSGWFAVSRHRK